MANSQVRVAPPSGVGTTSKAMGPVAVGVAVGDKTSDGVDAVVSMGVEAKVGVGPATSVAEAVGSIVPSASGADVEVHATPTEAIIATSNSSTLAMYLYRCHVLAGAERTAIPAAHSPGARCEPSLLSVTRRMPPSLPMDRASAATVVRWGLPRPGPATLPPFPST